ncbi:branched-chain amino acid transport system permease protein [Roseomonas rosea]|uniref:Branched-chain amino acid transport system permease protein n=1 Tax=Muricoccus roseus TaxID=198092 RepID=A0A1M6LSN4_9PROT|nr:branched-chain amino acid ABC transporter permease [Roseomonas rosea]SHJ74224.1 branched-chain amino acid transport system permease protein [Roseomonas rosea]
MPPQQAVAALPARASSNLRLGLLVPAVAAVVALALLPVFTSGYVVYVANVLLVYVVLSLGLNLVIGEAGQFSLSHAAFYGIGIYAAALGNKLLGLPLVGCLLLAGVVAALLGGVIGTIALRMRDIYLALTTFAFGEAMQWLFLNWEPVTGGPNGLRIPPSSLFGVEILNDKQAYPVVLGVALLMLGATVVISRSRLGRAFRAVRESDVAAMAMGIPVRRVKIMAFLLSAFYAGVAGGLFATFSTYIHPESLGFQTTMTVLTMVVVGGLGSTGGALLGAVVFGLISELLRQAPAVQEMTYGLILILFMMFVPRGLAPAVSRWVRGRGHV